jgi:glycosyltransferase involved in cell wall biosynthesis
MGRVCEAKGFHLALDAAARAGAPLLVAGAVHAFPEHVRYFEEQIRPRLDAARRFLGPVTGVRKRRLLAGARCAIVSSTTDETCSLVALEALAAGTPVVAFRRGALPEVVEHGRTGFLVESVAEMADAIAACSQLSTLACREAAQRRFDARVTVRRYLELYRALALTRRAGGAGAPPPPTAPGRATATR